MMMWHSERYFLWLQRTASHCNTLQHTATLATDDVAQREACPLAVALQQLQRVMPTKELIDS